MSANVHHNPDSAYILIKPSLSLEIPHFFFASYEEATDSEITEFNGKRTHALFLKERTARDTSLWQGWVDVTEAYKKERTASPEEVVVKVKAAPKATKAAPKRKKKVVIK